MARGKSKVVVGVFNTLDAVREAVDELVDAEFSENIGVISRHGKVKGTKSKDDETMWEEGAVIGAATGAGVGALWALGIAAQVLPGIGPIIGGGLLASVLASAAGGAAVASLAGALIGLGIPEEDAEYYEGEFKGGKTIVTVRANGREADAARIIVRNGGYDRTAAEGEACATTTNGSRARAGTATAAGGKIEVRRETARARKTPVKKGEVRVRKEVVTEHKTLNVPVEREEVVIERRPAHRAAAGGVGGGEEIRIPVKDEEVHVEKGVVVDEEVHVGKRKVRGTKAVTTPVRRERVKVEESGRTRVARR